MPNVPKYSYPGSSTGSGYGGYGGYGGVPVHSGSQYDYIGQAYGYPSGPDPDYLPPAVGGGGPDTGGGILGTGITWKDVLNAGKDIAPYILGGAATVSAIGQQNAANDLRKEALEAARQDYASRSPLRTRALSILTGAMPTPPDLSALRDTANPYAAGAAVTLPHVPIGGPPVAAMPSPGTQTIGDVLHDAFEGTTRTGSPAPTGSTYRPRLPDAPAIAPPSPGTTIDPLRPGRRGVR